MKIMKPTEFTTDDSDSLPTAVGGIMSEADDLPQGVVPAPADGSGIFHHPV